MALTTTERLVKEATTAIGRMKAGADDLQNVLVKSLASWKKSGAINNFAAFANALEKIDMPFANKNSLRQWFVDRGLIWEDNSFKYPADPDLRASLREQINTKTTPRWDAAKKEPEFKPMTDWDEIDKLAQRLEKRQKKGAEGDVIHGEIIAKLRELRNEAKELEQQAA